MLRVHDTAVLDSAQPFRFIPTETCLQLLRDILKDSELFLFLPLQLSEPLRADPAKEIHDLLLRRPVEDGEVQLGRHLPMRIESPVISF